MKFALRSKVSNKSNITWMEQENNTWFQSKIVLVPELLRYSHDVGHAASHARDTLVDPAVQRLEAVPIDVVCEYCKFYMLLLMLNVLLFCFVHIVYCVNKNKMLLSTHLALLGNWSLFVVQMRDKSFDLFEYIRGPRLLTWINFNPSID